MAGIVIQGAERRPKARGLLAGKSRAKCADREGEQQRELIDRVELEFPSIAHLLIHIPNGGSRRNRFEGWRLKAQGTKKGVSDLLLPVARGGRFGLWLEFKAAPPFDAPVTESQQHWCDLMVEQGYAAMVARGVDEALEALRAYLAQPPTRARGRTSVVS